MSTDRRARSWARAEARIAPPVDIDRLPAFVPAAFVVGGGPALLPAISGSCAVRGPARALATSLATSAVCRIVEGASTITQQLARNLFLTPDQTLERKAQEVVLAVQIEQRYSKKQILGMYLSRVYFGEGAYGLEAAARRYYDKPAAKLTLAEAAVLAGVLKSPTHYNPVDEPEAADPAAPRWCWGPWSRPARSPRPSPRHAVAHPAKALQALRPTRRRNISSTGSMRAPAS